MKRHQLRDDLTIIEQTYRGEQSFIVKERSTHKYFRFGFLEVLVMQQFTGEATAAEIAAALTEQGLTIKAAAVESFARKLDGMGLLHRSLTEKSVLLMERLRAERRRRVRRKRYEGSLLRMRWSVGDPDAFFDRWTPRLGFFFSRGFLMLSVALFLVYFAIVIARHEEFLASLRRMYQPSQWSVGFFVLFWLTGMTVVAIHEFGHGFACKYFGGEVHEMGAMLIYFQPAFFCNVNDAWTFPDLKARLWVTAAGSWIQMVLAGLAAIVWWAVTPDTLVSQVALIVVLIGGVMTVFANANPLIPLDGYYALSDWLEVPNLRQRAFAFLGTLGKRHLLRLNVPDPPADPRELKIFAIYGLLAIAYSATILALLLGRFAGWVNGTLGTLGLLAFLALVWAMLHEPLRAFARTVTAGVREHRAFWRGPRPWRRIAVGAGALLLLAVIIPWPIRVGGTFVAATPLDIALTAPEDAVIGQVLAREGGRVPAGVALVVLRNPDEEREAIARQSTADSLGALERLARAAGAVAEAARLAAAREAAASDVAALRARLDQFTLRAPVAAVVVTPRLETRTGARVEQGDTVVRLMAGGDSVELRIALDRSGATMVARGQRVSVAPYGDPGAARRAAVGSVATLARTGDANAAGQVEARVRVPASPAWRPGVTGEARVTIRRSNVLGALWWQLRTLVRTDVLL